MPGRREKSGLRFGQWTVIKRAAPVGARNSKWECKCDCGSVAIVYGSNLTSGISTKCRACCSVGINDLTGQKFGEWTVIERSNEIGQGRLKWKCQCSCGRIASLFPESLSYGRTKKCLECAAVSKCLPASEAGKQSYLRSYKKGAEDRNIPWDLTDEQALYLATLKCHYCDSSPSKVYTRGKTEAVRENGKFIVNGIDRIDNDLGYTIENSVPCCKHCNFAKHDLSLEEFLSWAKRLAKHQGF